MAKADTRRKAKAVAGAANPAIPDKLYFRIGEVAQILGVEAYVLRFWESEFPQLRPGKGGTGQRLYRRKDVDVALRIKRLLYNENYTIVGARQTLKTELREVQPELPLAIATALPNPLKLRQVQMELQEIAKLLAQPLPGTRRLPAEKKDHGAGRRGPRLAPHAAARDGENAESAPLLQTCDEEAG